MNDISPSMGAIPHEHGTAFRVWAPHADQAWVKGSFNDWQLIEMTKETESGNFYVDVPGVGHGDEYKYVLRNGENTFDRNDPRAFKVTSSVGNSVVYDHSLFDWQGDAFVAPSLNELVIYEMHVGSFVDAVNGPADLWDVKSQFEHLRKLGINAIQLMPVMEFAGDYSWGYNPAHVFAVESSYGGPDALKNFVKDAHAEGFAVLIDVVYNHFGPSDLATWQFDGWSEDDKGGIYFYQDWRSSTPWGDTRPDYGRSEVRDFIRDNAFMWLRDYHADGLRYDMTPYISSASGFSKDIAEGWSLMAWVNQQIREQFPHAYTIAEDLHADDLITDQGPAGAHFHAQWDARFVHPVREIVIEDFDEHRNIGELGDAIAHRYGLDSFARVIYTESHDEVANGKARVPQEIDADDACGYFAQKRSTAAAALMLTAPGIPMLFQGQELLEGEYFRDTVPLDWDRREEFIGIVRLYRDLVHLRLNRRETTRGLTGQYVNVFHLNESDNVIAFHRWKESGPHDDVVIVANLSNQTRTGYRIGMPAEGAWTLELNTDARIYSSLFTDAHAVDLTAVAEGADNLPAHAEVDLGPYAVLVYSRA